MKWSCWSASLFCHLVKSSVLRRIYCWSIISASKAVSVTTTKGTTSATATQYQETTTGTNENTSGYQETTTVTGDQETTTGTDVTTSGYQETTTGTDETSSGYQETTTLQDEHTSEYLNTTGTDETTSEHQETTTITVTTPAWEFYSYSGNLLTSPSSGNSSTSSESSSSSSTSSPSAPESFSIVSSPYEPPCDPCNCNNRVTVGHPQPCQCPSGQTKIPASSGNVCCKADKTDTFSWPKKCEGTTLTPANAFQYPCGNKVEKNCGQCTKGDYQEITAGAVKACCCNQTPD